MSCIGWMLNVKDESFLQGPKSTLWLDAFFQCPPHSNGRRLRSGDKNTVRNGSRFWSSAQYSSNALHRIRYYSCQRFRDIDYYLKLVQSRNRPSRPKIQYLLQQVSSFEYPFQANSRKFFLASIRLHFTMLHELYVLCIVLWRQYWTDMIIDLAGSFSSLFFPMGISGGQAVGCSQNTSILLISVSTNRAI